MNKIVTGECLVCGSEISTEGIPGVDTGFLVGVCMRCSDRELLEEGGAIHVLQEQPKESLFPLGTIRVTAEAITVLERAGQQSWEFLHRHVRGDWGELGRLEETVVTEEEIARGAAATDDDAKLNKIAVHHNCGRLLSSYQTNNEETVWLITHLGENGETVVLLPEEY